MKECDSMIAKSLTGTDYKDVRELDDAESDQEAVVESTEQHNGMFIGRYAFPRSDVS